MNSDERPRGAYDAILLRRAPPFVGRIVFGGLKPRAGAAVSDANERAAPRANAAN